MRSLEPLRGREAFRVARTKGTLLEGKLLKFYHLRRTDQPGPFLVAVNVNKQHGTAVQRNRIKRRIRESLRLLVREYGEELKAHQSCFSVVIVYKGIKGRPCDTIRFEDIRSDVAEFMRAIRPLYQSN